MAKNTTTVWECDAPICGTTEVIQSPYAYSPPEGWSTINFSLAETEEECMCSCHDYDSDDAGHEEDECSCVNTEDGEYTYCTDCTNKFKMQYLPRKKGGLL